MKKFITALIIVAIVLVGLFIYASPSSNGGVIKSDDGSAKITVSESALPADVKKSDISITKEGEDTYVLEPDGLEFLEPVTIELVSQSTDDSIPLPLLISGNGDEEVTKLLSDITIDIDPDSDSRVITAKLSHFSKIKIKQNILYLNINPTGETYVGLTVPAKGTLKWPKNYQLADAFTFVDNKLYLAGLITPKGDVLSPQKRIDGRPSMTAFTFGNEISFESNDFTCTKEGKGSLQWELPISGTVRFVYGNGHAVEEPASIYPRINVPVKCVKPDLIYLGPQYFIDCGTYNGKPKVLTGYYRYDENQQMITDADGNGYDRETGKLVVCPPK